VSKVTRKGDGTKLLKERIKTPGTVDVGVIDAGLHEDSLLTVATIAYANEYGTETIPERSFFRSTIIEVKKGLIALQTKLMKQIVDGKISAEKALGLLGEFLSDAIRQKIVSLRTPPNAPATLKAKAPKTNPLVDSGQLKNSITYEVNR